MLANPSTAALRMSLFSDLNASSKIGMQAGVAMASMATALTMGFSSANAATRTGSAEASPQAAERLGCIPAHAPGRSVLHCSHHGGQGALVVVPTQRLRGALLLQHRSMGEEIQPIGSLLLLPQLHDRAAIVTDGAPAAQADITGIFHHLEREGVGRVTFETVGADAHVSAEHAFGAIEPVLDDHLLIAAEDDTSTICKT